VRLCVVMLKQPAPLSLNFGAKSSNSHVFFLLKISLCKCETMRCYDETTSSFVAKFRCEIFQQFYAVAIERHSSLASQDEFLIRKPLDDNEKDFDLYLSRVLRSVLNRELHSNTKCTARAFSPKLLSKHCQCLHPFFPRFVQNLTRNRIRPESRLQIKRRKKPSHQLYNFINWLQRYSSTVIYRCIARLQILWIPLIPQCSPYTLSYFLWIPFYLQTVQIL
jgi:hypothetical protein